jgi:cell wall-associated NlpC family hydrolase
MAHKTPHRAVTTIVALAASLALVACAGDVTGGGEIAVGDVGDEELLVGMDDSNEAITFASTLAAGDRARVCNAPSGLRQRSGAGTSYTVLRVVPEGTTVKILARSGVWYKNDWSGRVGWSHGTYLCKVSGGGGSGTGFNSPTTPAGAISIAKAAVGFSYWWGGGRFAAGASHGACYGSCPSCSHSGSYGADCSGFIGKVWKLPPAMPMNANKHPYSTYHFLNQANYWKRITRSSMKAADALVYHSSGAGHIFLYEKGDRWGSMWTYEARGCSYGVVHNVRTAGTAYRAIRRSGF